MVNFLPSKFDNKREIEGLLISEWESEWSSTQKGVTTRNFFPNVKAAGILKTKKNEQYDRSDSDRPLLTKCPSAQIWIC
jgi:hypothetical protein